MTDTMAKKGESKKWANLPRFWRFYLIITCALVIASLLFLNYVRSSLKLFEASQPDNYMDNLLRSIRKMSPEKLAAWIELPELVESRFFDKEAYPVSIARQMLNSNLTFSGGKPSGGSIEYSILSDGVKVADIILQSTGEQVRLGLLSIPKWSASKINYVMSDNNTYKITYPSFYRVFVNGLELDERDRTKSFPLPGYEHEAKYVQFPVMFECSIENLPEKPNIEVYNNHGEEVHFEMKGNKIEVSPVFNPSEFPDELEAEINVLKIAKTWSMFLTADLYGPLYGLEEARASFIRGSDFWNMAYAYATGPDITFVSDHRIDSFTNESVTDYIRYTDDCFSCVVYFEKNMTLSNGEVRTDVFNSRLFFVFYDDTDDGVENSRWCISDMQAVTNVAS